MNVISGNNMESTLVSRPSRGRVQVYIPLTTAWLIIILGEGPSSFSYAVISRREREWKPKATDIENKWFTQTSSRIPRVRNLVRFVANVQVFFFYWKYTIVIYMRNTQCCYTTVLFIYIRYRNRYTYCIFITLIHLL